MDSTTPPPNCLDQILRSGLFQGPDDDLKRDLSYGDDWFALLRHLFVLVTAGYLVVQHVTRQSTLSVRTSVVICLALAAIGGGLQWLIDQAVNNPTTTAVTSMTLLTLIMIVLALTGGVPDPEDFDGPPELTQWATASSTETRRRRFDGSVERRCGLYGEKRVLATDASQNPMDQIVKDLYAAESVSMSSFDSTARTDPAPKTPGLCGCCRRGQGTSSAEAYQPPETLITLEQNREEELLGGRQTPRADSLFAYPSLLSSPEDGKLAKDTILRRHSTADQEISLKMQQERATRPDADDEFLRHKLKTKAYRKTTAPAAAAAATCLMCRGASDLSTITTTRRIESAAKPLKSRLERRSGGRKVELRRRKSGRTAAAAVEPKNFHVLMSVLLVVFTMVCIVHSVMKACRQHYVLPPPVVAHPMWKRPYDQEPPASARV